MTRPMRFAWALLIQVALGIAALEAVRPTVVSGRYLQRLSSTEVTIRWRTDVPTDGRVRYGTSAGNLAVYPTGTSARTEHAVTLTGLSPSTSYFYAVGTPTGILAGGDAEHRFATSPTAGTRSPTRFWLLGDAGHGTRSGSFAPDVRDAAAAWAASHPLAGRPGPDHLLLLGDNAYPMGTDADYQIALFDTHGALLRRVPVWPAVGNHDVDSPGYSEDAQTGAYFDIFTLPTRGEAGGVGSDRESYYSFDVANVHVIVLNSSHPPYLASLEIGNPMLAWLERDLAATDQEWIIAFWHFPPYGKATYDSDVVNGLRRPRENYLPMLEAAGIDLVLGAHNHYYARSYPLNGAYGLSSTNAARILDHGDGRPGGSGAYTRAVKGPGTIYLVSGGASSVLSAEKLGHHPVMFTEQNIPGSVFIDVDGLRLDAYFVDYTGAVRDSFSIVKSGSGPVADATPPTAPTDLAASATGSRQVDLTWRPATDAESGIGKYQIYRGGALVGTATGTTFQDRGLSPQTTYVYSVAAVNGARLVGAQSETASATTPADPVQPLAVGVSVTSYSPADRLEMNRPTAVATCSGGIGPYDWTIDWDGGDHLEQVQQASSPRTTRLPAAHPGLDEGAHTLRVACVDLTWQSRGEATATISIGERQITGELVLVGNLKWLGDELLALEGAAHSVRLRVAAGHYPGARYDYRIAWGDGTADFVAARSTATTISATHRYLPAPADHALVATIEDPARGKSHTIRADVRVVPRAVYDQPAPSIRVSPGQVAFEAASGGADPTPRTVGLTNGGAGAVSWTATSDTGWLRASPASGSLGVGQTVVLTLAPSLDGLSDGEHVGSVAIAAPGAVGSPQVVTATLVVAAAGDRRELVIAETVSGFRTLGDTATTLVLAQTFAAPAASIQGIEVGLSRVGSPPGEVTASIRRALTGPNLASVRLASGGISTDYRNPTPVSGAFSAPAALVPGEIYLLVLSVPVANHTNYYRWSVDTGDPYPDGMVQVGAKLYHFQDALATIVYGAP